MRPASRCSARGAIAALAIWALAGLAAAPSQEVQPLPETPTLKVTTELVVLHVTVGDGDRTLPDLPCAAFAVSEDGRPQEVSICERGTQPLTLGLVVDSSTSMARYRELVASAGGAFAALGNPENQIFVLQFNEYVRSALPPGMLFTSSAEQVRSSLSSLFARGRTALHDAIDRAIEYANRSDRLKKALVLVSDGGDNASRRTFEEIVERARRANVLIYAIAIIDADNKDARPDRLRRLARDTGGIVFTPRHSRDLPGAFEQIAHDLRAGYTLGYVSNNERHDGRYRETRVAVRAPGVERVEVRTRAGYMAPGDQDVPPSR